MNRNFPLKGEIIRDPQKFPRGKQTQMGHPTPEQRMVLHQGSVLLPRSVLPVHYSPRPLTPFSSLLAPIPTPTKSFLYFSKKWPMLTVQQLSHLAFFPLIVESPITSLQFNQSQSLQSKLMVLLIVQFSLKHFGLSI